MTRKILLGAVLVVALAQIVPVSRTNPPVAGEVAGPEVVRQTLRRACYDCHSHETRWPWYSYVAPVSWLVAHDVSEGREHLNFSTWAGYDAEERAEKREEIWEEVDEGEMPLWFYLPLHPDARLGEEEKTALRDWALRVDGTDSAPPDSG